MVSGMRKQGEYEQVRKIGVEKKKEKQGEY